MFFPANVKYAVLSAAFLLASVRLLAQSSSGAISGVIADSSGASVSGASVALVNENTSDQRQDKSSENGAFSFAAVSNGTYTVKVEHPGFREARRTGIVLSANERLSVGSIELTVGSVTESVVVKAENTNVQTVSSERSGMLTGTQMERIMTRGRDPVSLLRLLPGVVYQTDSDSLGGTFGTSSPQIGGTRNQWNTLNFDGQSGNDADLVNSFSTSANMEAIAEVKVLMNNYQAEYGRNSGATVNVISKSGSRDFHGSIYWFKRHEQWNANDFFNNRNRVAKPLFRSDSLGLTIGGPIYIPGKFNRDRDKLFFFYSREDWRVRFPRPPRQTTMPTELERNGDFSQSFDLNNQLIRITDPLTRQQFPGNVVPSSRINKNGQAILNLFPVPNMLNRTITGGNFNYQHQEITEQPKKSNLPKIDYLPTSKDKFSARIKTWWSDTRGYQGLAAVNSNWDQLFHHYLYTSDSYQGTYTRIFSPRIVNEFAFGYRVLGELGPAESATTFDPILRSKRNVAVGQLYPGNNPLGIVPQASFGGVPSAANIALDGRIPIDAKDEFFTYSNNLSVTQGTHSLKFGVYAEQISASEGPRANFAGSFNFGRDANNPFDSNYAYSNALLGNFTQYSEASARTAAATKGFLLEFFAQDTWRASRKLTFDYGMRFSRATPWRLRDLEGAAFVLGNYDPRNAPPYFRPVRDPSGARVGQNPITGELVPAVMIGAFVPGVGVPFGGMVHATDDPLNGGFVEQQGFQLGPRIGFAYDVTGDGKTAIRGGFGITKQMLTSNGLFWGLNTNPPNQLNPTIFYGNMDTFLNVSGVLFPNDVNGLERSPKTPSVYNYSIGVQRDIGFNTVLDVSYVGNVARHLQQIRNLNAIPYGSRFRPENQDSTTNTPLPDNFFRPNPGYGNINYREYSGISNYNSLQMTLNRRFAQGFQFGVAYTWSKTMDLTSGDGGTLPTFIPAKAWLYGKASFDQTHVAVVNYSWELPRASRMANNALVRTALDGWQLAGITSFVSGFPSGISLNTTDGVDIPGGGDGVRVNVLEKAPLPRSERTFDRWFNTAAFARPARGTSGNAPKDVFRQPGVSNFDLSLFKNFPVGSESRNLQFRAEAYNVFNHTQYQTVDEAARFDPSGRQVNPRFGQVISTRSPRTMQLALTFRF